MNDLTTIPTDPETLRLIKAIAEGAPQSPAELAALAECSEALATAFAVLHSDAIDAEATRARLNGKANVAKAHRIVGKALDKINAGLEGIDAFDAAELMKPALRVLEASEKARLAERDDTARLPVFHITINKGAMQMHAVDLDTMQIIDDISPKALRGDL